MPFFSPSSQIGEQFTTWLARSGGGYKKDRPAQDIVNRCLKLSSFAAKRRKRFCEESVFSKSLF